MNRTHLHLLTLGAFCLVSILLFPPYVVRYQSSASSARNGGVDHVTLFRPLWSPPEEGFYERGELTSAPGIVLEASVDRGMLLVELLVVIGVLGVLLALASRGRAAPE